MEVFRLALQIDSRIAYSHHYLAFNLDWLAEHPEEVERHYREAIKLQRGHPWWWWSRWFAYLATRGRFRDARQAWRDALDEFSLGGDESSRWLYLSLHRWVARWLLHWSELDFAENVLNAIPAEIAETTQQQFLLPVRPRPGCRGNGGTPISAGLVGDYRQHAFSTGPGTNWG